VVKFYEWKSANFTKNYLWLNLEAVVLDESKVWVPVWQNLLFVHFVRSVPLANLVCVSLHERKWVAIGFLSVARALIVNCLPLMQLNLVHLVCKSVQNVNDGQVAAIVYRLIGQQNFV
jgi:hypothetical protein